MFVESELHNYQRTEATSEGFMGIVSLQHICPQKKNHVFTSSFPPGSLGIPSSEADQCVESKFLHKISNGRFLYKYDYTLFSTEKKCLQQ
jgi:hypothetical protein